MLRRAAPLLVMLAVLCIAADKPDFKTWLSPDHFDVHAIMGDPPADNSPEHKDELAKMLSLQAHRTAADVARCKSEEEVTVFAFSTVLGPDFNKENCPKTAALMKAAYQQTRSVSNVAKNTWKRTRPPNVDDRIIPCVTYEFTYSYPSGHATRGVMWATLLAQIFPDESEDLFARGKEIGTDRSLAGMHWPSDVVAGQKLGAAAAAQLLKDDDFKQQLAEAKAECTAIVHPVATAATQPTK